MRYEEFLVLFNAHIKTGTLYILLSLLITLLIYRKYILSIFDPLFFNAIFSGAGYSVVFFLYKEGLVSSFYLYSFLCTQVAYFLGFLVFKPIKYIKTMKNSIDLLKLSFTPRIIVLYYLSGFLYILSHLILYYYKGIPLFMDSRLEKGVGGFGVLIRTDIVTSSVILIVLMCKILCKARLTALDIILGVCFILFSVLSGSKSTFISLIFVGFYVSLFLNIKFKTYRQVKIFKKISFKVFIFAFFAAIFVLILRKEGNPLFKLMFRVIMTGDVYMMAYVNDTIKNINGNFFNALIGPTLAGFKLISWDLVPKPLGQQLFDYLYHTNVLVGANARHNVFGLAYLGPYFSVIFSFCLGLITSFIRNKSIFFYRKNMEGIILFVLLVRPVFSIEADIVYAIYQYTSIFSIFSVLYLVSLIISESINQKIPFMKEQYSNVKN